MILFIYRQQAEDDLWWLCLRCNATRWHKVMTFHLAVTRSELSMLPMLSAIRPHNVTKLIQGNMLYGHIKHPFTSHSQCVTLLLYNRAGRHIFSWMAIWWVTDLQLYTESVSGTLTNQSFNLNTLKKGTSLPKRSLAIFQQKNNIWFLRTLTTNYKSYTF